MLHEFKLPELGENITTADVTKVLVKTGDRLKKDQPVLELETEKAAFELPSEMAGTVKEIRVKAGDKIKVGQVVMVIEGEGEEVRGEELGVRGEKKKEARKTEVKEEKEKIEEKKPPLPLPPHSLPPQEIPASPLVRRIAREMGVDLAQVAPSGAGGRMTVDDVKKHFQQSEIAGTVCEPPLPDFSKWGPVERKPMSNVRRTTTHHIAQAWSVIPHVTQFDEADITELELLRKRFSKRVEAAGGHLSLTAIVLKVAASALKVFPQMNASVDVGKEEIILKNYFHIGIAVDTDRGLLVPVIRDVDQKNILEIAIELSQITEKARSKKLTLDEMQGASFTITNLGNIGGSHFTPIIHWPEVAILGVGRAAVKSVRVEDKWEARTMLPLSLSYDHRLIDGADGARFLRWLADAVQEPFLMDLEG